MIHPDTELVWINDRVGRGVRATRPLAVGTLLWVRDRFDTVLEPEALDRLPAPDLELALRLGYRDHTGRTIVCGDAGRYVNHSCRPSMRGIGPDAMIAVRDVATGEEVTCDYAECNLSAPLECLCGASNCRRWIDAGDLGRFSSDWQGEVTAALCASAAAEQAILPYAVDGERIAEVLAGRRACPPLLEVWLAVDPRVAATSPRTSPA